MNKNPRIYVVEDDPPMNALICTFLENNGFSQVEGFGSTEEMIQKLDSFKPTIIIQDYDLPGMNGLESIQKVKPKYSNVDYIFLSGQNSIEVAIESIKCGAFDYLVKDSFAKENVLVKVRNLIRFRVLEKKQKRFLYFLIVSVALLVTTSIILLYQLMHT